MLWPAGIQVAKKKIRRRRKHTEKKTKNSKVKNPCEGEKNKFFNQTLRIITSSWVLCWRVKIKTKNIKNLNFVCRVIDKKYSEHVVNSHMHVWDYYYVCGLVADCYYTIILGVNVIDAMCRLVVNIIIHWHILHTFHKRKIFKSRHDGEDRIDEWMSEQVNPIIWG